MQVRGADDNDGKNLVELIIASGRQSLAAIFDIDTKHNCKGFLLSALVNKEGQYGYANHWLIEHKEQVIGCVSAWHSELDQGFHQATLHSVLQYFGPKHSLEVLARSQIVQDFIPKPQKHQYCIGHLAVVPVFQRQGAATALLNFMSQKALLQGKSQLSLDVPADNQAALNFYLHQGFEVQASSLLTSAMQKRGFGPHLHMVKTLIQPLAF